MDAKERQAVLFRVSKKGETGKHVDVEQEIELNLKEAEAAWPDFKVCYETFKNTIV